MREIYYNSDITPKVANEIKLLALYYDKINIVSDVFYSPKFEKTNGKFEFAGTEDFPFVPKTFHEDYKILLDEGLMSITQRDENASDPYNSKFGEKIGEAIKASDDFIFPLHPERLDGKIITEEVYDMMHSILGFEWGKPIELNFVLRYYAMKLQWFIKLLIEGKNCISSSNNLNHLFLNFVRNSEEENFPAGTSGYTKSLAFEAL
ncbi:MAG: hypothetical protein ABJA76_20145, partial [Mucilaginibacter sp.]